jgi:hypothetical protein
MAHIGAEAKADGYRVPPDIDPARDDLSDDTLADVLRTLHAAPQVYRDKGRDVVLHSRGAKKAVVLASELDPKLGDYWSVKTTYPTEYRSVWGAPEGAGRLTFPATPDETSGASQTRPLDTATSQPSRTGLEVTSEAFQYRSQAPAVQVTTRRRRAVEPGILASQPRFYSPLARAFDKARQDTMPAKQWALWLASNKAQQGLKDDEIQFSGVMDYLELRGKDKVTKVEIADYLSGSGVVVNTVEKGGRPDYKNMADDDLYLEYERVHGYPAEDS